MKRCILLVMVFLFLCKSVYAEFSNKRPAKYTILDAYAIYKTVPTQDNRLSHSLIYGSFIGFCDGLLLYNSFKYHNNEEIFNCMTNRHLFDWIDTVFNKYKYNQINGKDYFWIHFIKSLDEACGVKL